MQLERFGNYWGESLIVNETAIMDDNGNLLPRGQVGELVHRGPNVMMGYYKDPKATEEARKFGWHHTGDLALIDEHGEVLFLDRKKDMIKSGGENVASVKIEETLLAHPAVQNAAVVGLPHPQWGEAVSAFVKLKPGAQADEAGIAEHCRKHLGGFQVPKLVRILDEMPMTATGKLRKVELRQAFSEHFARRAREVADQRIVIPGRDAKCASHRESRIPGLASARPGMTEQINMAILESTIAPSSAAYKANRDGMLALIARMRALEERTRAASAAAKDRFHKRGQLLPRERVALVLDPGSPFIELSTLAGYMFDVPDADKSVPGGGLIAGIGFVSGIRCMVSANDSGIDAGALQPYGLDKTLRVQELALENKLPYVQLVESAGANLLRYRVEDFVRGGNIFRNLARLSAAGLPVVTVTHGSSTAGGAYQTGLSDYIVMVRGRTRAFLAGPPLLKAATGEIATEEELGGAEMHTSHFRARRLSRRGRPRCAAHRARDHGQSGMGPAEAGGTRRSSRRATMPRNCSASCRWTTSGRSTCARRSRASSTIPISPSSAPNYGPATVCGHARIEGQAIGIITNNGPLDRARRQQGDAFHPGLLPVAHAAALSEQHHRLHGRQGL